MTEYCYSLQPSRREELSPLCSWRLAIPSTDHTDLHFSANFGNAENKREGQKYLGICGDLIVLWKIFLNKRSSNMLARKLFTPICWRHIFLDYMNSKYYLIFSIFTLLQFSCVILPLLYFLFSPNSPVFLNKFLCLCSLLLFIFRACPRWVTKLRHIILCYLSKVKIGQHKFSVIKISFHCFSQTPWGQSKPLKWIDAKLILWKRILFFKLPKSLFWNSPLPSINLLHASPEFRASVKNQL